MERRIGKEEDDEWKRRKGAEEWGIGQRKREIVNELELVIAVQTKIQRKKL